MYREREGSLFAWSTGLIIGAAFMIVVFRLPELFHLQPILDEYQQGLYDYIMDTFSFFFIVSAILLVVCIGGDDE